MPPLSLLPPSENPIRRANAAVILRNEATKNPHLKKAEVSGLRKYRGILRLALLAQDDRLFFIQPVKSEFLYKKTADIMSAVIWYDMGL